MREQVEELSAVLGQPPIAGLHMAELAFDNPERMLNLCAHHGDDPVDSFVEGVQWVALRSFSHDTPDPAWRTPLRGRR